MTSQPDADELTVLTANLGIVETDGDEFVFTVNVRYPVTWKGDELCAMCEKGLPEGWRIAEFTDSKPLYFPTDHPLVKHIVENEMLNGEVIRLDGATRLAPT